MKSTIKILIICLTVFASVPTYADDKTELQGEWLFTSGEVNGTPMSQLLKRKGANDFRIIIKDDLLTMTATGLPDHTYNFTLDPTKSPKTIRTVLTKTSGKAPKGTVGLGIYEIKGKQLKLCLTNGKNVPLPKKFEAPRESGLSVLFLTRKE